MRTVVLAGLVVLCGTIFSGAQETRATVSGSIQDPNGAVIPGAKVTARNIRTGVVTTATAAADGNYTIPFLIPGNYIISADAQGFKTAQHTNVILHVGDKLEVDLMLPVGSVTEVVTVKDTPPLLETGTATRGELIGSESVEKLPLVGRNPFMLAQLVPGVQFQGNPAFQRPFDNGDNANFSISGGLRQSNSFLIDGAPDDAVSDTAGDRSHANLNVAYIPSVDATQEFKIVQNFYDAQYGRTGGGIFNVSTKAGTNVFHGDAYYYLRRYQLDANSVSNKIAGLPRYSLDPVTKDNLGGHTLDDWGGTLGGPVRIPHVYNGKDRTFFFLSYEHYHEVQPTPTLTTVPTLAERQGDFSAAGEPIIYDPWTTHLDSNGNCCIRDAFLDNKIPQDRLSVSPGLQLANAYPKPNVGTGLLVNNYSTGANTSEDHFQNFLARVDHNFSDKERMYFRYAHGRRNQIDHGAYNFTGPLYDSQDPLGRSNDSAVVDSITVFSPRVLMDLRASLARYTEVVARSAVYGYDDTKLGFSQNFNSERFVPVPPRISMGNQSNIPDAGTRNPRYGISTVIGFQPSLQMLYGKHSIHVGADLRNIAFGTGGGSFVYGGGAFAFNANFTQANPTASYNGTSGSPVASLLLGAPAASNSSINSIISYTPRLLYRWWYQGYYIQDDIKVTNKLTINAGIRYDIEGSPAESQNRMNRGFDTTDPSPLAGIAQTAPASVCPACQQLVGGLYFAGVGGQSSAAFNTQYGHIQPRIGVVYQLFPNTVLRGGYGMFYLPEAAFGAAQGFAQDTAYVPNNIMGGTTPDLYIPRGADPLAPPLKDPFPSVLQPAGSSLGLATFLGQSIIFNNPDRKIPRADQWSAGVEQQLPFGVKADLSYVGMHTQDINTNDNDAGGARNLNVLSASQISSVQQTVAASPTGANSTYQTASQYLGTAVANPFAGNLPNTNLNGSTLSRQQLLLPYPQFLSVNYGQESVGQLWYNAAQLMIEKRYANGFSIMGSYTWSKTEEALAFLNPQDPAPHKNIGATDRPQHLVISALYELPFGKGHRFLGDVNRPTELLVGGWQLNYIETIQSGLPVGLPGNVNLIGDPQATNKNHQTWFNPCVQLAPSFNSATGSYTPGAISLQGQPSSCSPVWQVINSSHLDYRQSGFYSSAIRNPNAPNTDLSLIKALRFTERYSGQFRLEAFNLTNTWVPGGPNTNATSGAFGSISHSQSNIGRQVQMAFKFIF
ncbi:MAG TPA: carboxypeptidase regulatory-like domain-containing protein [Acidobacteriaceae bacterium]|nr:carboxypeptidase regulatory-like domain-containing protein [Acidobacteriaceae bacterium]